MLSRRMSFTCSAAEVGDLNVWRGGVLRCHYGAQVAFANTRTQPHAVPGLRRQGFRRVGSYIGSNGRDHIAIMVRINRPIRRKKTAKKVRK